MDQELDKKDLEEDERPHAEERAFNGHPDHPPATPDQPVEGNQELIRQPD
ncbi:MAG TPA: hypothetical protein VNT25_07295 [Allosphingosinicella sp.]|nr:hypothetical protein [Allosphingosinicella sp.]